jgi:hypothetical protein
VTNSTIITRDTDPHGALKAIMDCIKNAEGFREGTGEEMVLLITHAAYFNLPYFHNRDDWLNRD